MTIYLWFNAVAYALFAIWCTVAPSATAAGIGYGLPTNSAKSEYITVYGGLEMALAIFFLLGALRDDLRWPAFVFALCLYSSLVVFRLGTLVTLPGLSRTIYILFALEATLAVIGWVLYLRRAS